MLWAWHWRSRTAFRATLVVILLFLGLLWQTGLLILRWGGTAALVACVVLAGLGLIALAAVAGRRDRQVR